MKKKQMEPAKIPKPQRIKFRINGSDIEFGIRTKNRDKFYSDPVSFCQAHSHRIVGAMLPAGSRRILGEARAILPNGGLIYSNTGNHVEYATAECLGAKELALHETAGLEILAEGARRFNENNLHLPKISLHKTNCGCELDLNKSPKFGWGSHASFLSFEWVTYDQRENLLKEFLMSFWPLIGNGWFLVNRQGLQFIFSQRAINIFTGKNSQSTTDLRPMFHVRDEPHTHIDEAVWKRIHEISLNANMSQVQLLLKYGIYDLVLAMVETKGFLRPLPLIDHEALGYEEIATAYNAVSNIFNQDIRFRRAVKLKNGRSWTSLDFQLHYFNEARRFFAEGKGTLTPEKKVVLALWGATLKALRRWDLPLLATYLDWAAIIYYEVSPRIKRLGFNPELLFAPPDFPSHIFPAAPTKPPAPPGIPYDYQWERQGKNENLLDYLLYFITFYANVDTSASPYGLYLRKGLIKQIFTPEEIQFAKNNPPPRTRAKLREEIIRNPPDNKALEAWNWNFVHFGSSHDFTSKVYFDLPNPYRHTIKTDLNEFRRPPPPPPPTPIYDPTPVIPYGGS